MIHVIAKEFIDLTPDLIAVAEGYDMGGQGLPVPMTSRSFLIRPGVPVFQTIEATVLVHHENPFLDEDSMFKSASYGDFWENSAPKVRNV